MRAGLIAVIVMGLATREHIGFKLDKQARVRFVEVCDSGDCVWIKSWSIKVGQEVRKKVSATYTGYEVLDRKTTARGMEASK